MSKTSGFKAAVNAIVSAKLVAVPITSMLSSFFEQLPDGRTHDIAAID